MIYAKQDPAKMVNINPQIFLDLLVALGGYATGYDIFEGNIYEGHSLIHFIEKIASKLNLDKPIIVADSGLYQKITS